MYDLGSNPSRFHLSIMVVHGKHSFQNIVLGEIGVIFDFHREPSSEPDISNLYLCIPRCPFIHPENFSNLSFYVEDV